MGPATFVDDFVYKYICTKSSDWHAPINVEMRGGRDHLFEQPERLKKEEEKTKVCGQWSKISFSSSSVLEIAESLLKKGKFELKLPIFSVRYHYFHFTFMPSPTLNFSRAKSVKSITLYFLLSPVISTFDLLLKILRVRDIKPCWTSCTRHIVIAMSRPLCSPLASRLLMDHPGHSM